MNHHGIMTHHHYVIFTIITGVSKLLFRLFSRYFRPINFLISFCVRQLLADSVSLVALAVACKSAWQQGMYLKHGSKLKKNTPLKFNMELKNFSIEKEHHLPYLCFFSVPCQFFRGVQDSARCHQQMTKHRFFCWPAGPCENPQILAFVSRAPLDTSFSIDCYREGGVSNIYAQRGS